MKHKIERTIDDVVDDIQRIDYNNQLIAKALDNTFKLHCYYLHTYRELFKSKLTGRIKYIVTFYPKNERLTITDLDTNMVYE